MRRGRPQLGPDLVDHLEVDAATADRLRAILATLSGDLPSVAAAEGLGLSESAFHKLRRRGIEGMVAAVAGGRPGRPPQSPEATSPEEVAALRRELAELKFQVEGARLREQIALLRPEALIDPGVGREKKGRKKQGEDRRRKKARRKMDRARRG